MKEDKKLIVPPCHFCNFKSADCAYGNLRYSTSCYDLLKEEKENKNEKTKTL